MMTCGELLELLLDFVSGELRQNEVQRIKDHLNDCSPCVAILNTYRLTIQLARQLPCNPLPPPCEQRLRAAVLEQCNQQLSGDA
jgi:anti-sigma factor RsiW